MGRPEGSPEEEGRPDSPEGGGPPHRPESLASCGATRTEV